MMDSSETTCNLSPPPGSDPIPECTPGTASAGVVKVAKATRKFLLLKLRAAVRITHPRVAVREVKLGS